MLLAGIGVALVLEGLVVLLAPARLDDALALLARIPVATRRLLGLVAVTGGVIVLNIAL